MKASCQVFHYSCELLIIVLICENKITSVVPNEDLRTTLRVVEEQQVTLLGYRQDLVCRSCDEREGKRELNLSVVSRMKCLDRN